MHRVQSSLPNRVNHSPRKRKKLDLNTVGRSRKSQSAAAAAAPATGRGQVLGGELAESSKIGDVGAGKQEDSLDKAVRPSGESSAKLTQGHDLETPKRSRLQAEVSKRKQSMPSSSALSSPGTGTCSVRDRNEDGNNKKKGKFSKAETSTIVDEVKSYAQARGISVEYLCTEGYHKHLRGAWVTISECLPDRTVKAVYRHAKRQLHGLKRSPWLENELSALAYLVESHGKKWKLIEQEIGRSADTCRDKYRELVVEPTKGLWTDEEEKLLVKIIEGKMQHSGGHETTSMEWDEVAKQMGTRGRIACMKKWSYMQAKRDEELLGRHEDSELSLKLSFAKEVLKTGAQDETELTWTKLPVQRPQRCWAQLRKNLPPTMPLPEAAKLTIKRIERRISREASNDSVTAKPKTAPRKGKTQDSSRSVPTGSLNGFGTGSGTQAKGASEKVDSSPRLPNNGTCVNPAAGAKESEDETQIMWQQGLMNGRATVEGRSESINDGKEGEKDILADKDGKKIKKRKKKKIKNKKKRKREEAEGKKRNQIRKVATLGS